ncbi:hypothetical protein ACJRO7_020023 [Eucalyptus globulus]|uniref:Uncharacterized protein n=1 Tax=Eucalyptus globulus TaxID=34317 RepID=A0ABD3KNC3_EUCGL
MAGEVTGAQTRGRVGDPHLDLGRGCNSLPPSPCFWLARVTNPHQGTRDLAGHGRYPTGNGAVARGEGGPVALSYIFFFQF